MKQLIYTYTPHPDTARPVDEHSNVIIDLWSVLSQKQTYTLYTALDITTNLRETLSLPEVHYDDMPTVKTALLGSEKYQTAHLTRRIRGPSSGDGYPGDFIYSVPSLIKSFIVRDDRARAGTRPLVGFYPASEMPIPASATAAVHVTPALFAAAAAAAADDEERPVLMILCINSLMMAHLLYKAGIEEREYFFATFPTAEKALKWKVAAALEKANVLHTQAVILRVHTGVKQMRMYAGKSYSDYVIKDVNIIPPEIDTCLRSIEGDIGVKYAEIPESTPDYSSIIADITMLLRLTATQYYSISKPMQYNSSTTLVMIKDEIRRLTLNLRTRLKTHTL